MKSNTLYQDFQAAVPSGVAACFLTALRKKYGTEGKTGCKGLSSHLPAFSVADILAGGEKEDCGHLAFVL